MDKRHLHHIWRQLRRLSYWYFLIAFVASSFVFILAYRNNNLTALRLRDQLLANDQAGTHVEESLDSLRSYIYGHMNASLAGGPDSIYPPIQLKGTYNRMVAAEQQQVAASNAQIAVQADNSCLGQFPGEKTGYLLCVQNYEAGHDVMAQPIPADLYKFDFISPRWSPDLAGWSLVLAIVFLVLFVFRYGLELWLHYNLSHHE